MGWGYNEGFNVALLVWLGFIQVVEMVGVIVFIFKRHRQPIQARWPWLVVSSQITLRIWTAIYSIQAATRSMPCWVLVFSAFVVDQVAVFYFVRVFILYFTFNRTIEQISRGDRRMSGLWFLRFVSLSLSPSVLSFAPSLNCCWTDTKTCFSPNRW